MTSSERGASRERLDTVPISRVHSKQVVIFTRIVSASQNPVSAPPESALSTAPAATPAAVPDENPPWTLAAVLALAVLTVVAIVACVLGVAYAFHSRVAPPGPWLKDLNHAEIIVGGQLLAYILVILLMYKLVENSSSAPALETIRWNWPRNWRSYLLAGVTLEVCLLPLAYLLPMPKNLPMDEFFRTARDAYILSLFGVLFAPLFEELFFRGFLYPVLARRLGMPLSIVLTALAFSAIHAPQLRGSWAPVLVIFLVGLVLTTVRAVKKSVAATMLMHMAYNGTIFVVAYIATGGFRHMERFSP